MEIWILLKMAYHTPGIGHALLTAGVGVASVAGRYYLTKHGKVIKAAVLDKLAYLAGGFIFLDLFLKVGKAITHLLL